MSKCGTGGTSEDLVTSDFARTDGKKFEYEPRNRRCINNATALCHLNLSVALTNRPSIFSIFKMTAATHCSFAHAQKSEQQGNKAGPSD